MMCIPFEKFQGTGNDFIIIDHRDKRFEKILEPGVITKMCNRHLGIGGDGVILLENSQTSDFKMVYYNADGYQSSMCGNGGRCILAFARNKGIVGSSSIFEAIDGLHKGVVNKDGTVSLQMSDVPFVTKVNPNSFLINTGSPHYVHFCDKIPDDIRQSGASIRYSDPFQKEGINVNFVVEKPDGLMVATYERGVENETLSCGTGVTAAAIAKAYKHKRFGKFSQKIITKGGSLGVDFTLSDDGRCTDVWLKGPAIHVFKGEYFITNPES